MASSFSSWNASRKQQKEEKARQKLENQQKAQEAQAKVQLKAREAQENAQSWLSQVQDCGKILKSTKEPAIFFSRYEVLIEQTTRLADASNAGYIEFAKINVDLNQALREAVDKWDEAVNEFINRVYRKMLKEVEAAKSVNGKTKKIDTFFASMNAHTEKMEPSNIELLESLRTECDGMIRGWEVTL